MRSHSRGLVRSKTSSSTSTCAVSSDALGCSSSGLLFLSPLLYLRWWTFSAADAFPSTSTRMGQRSGMSPERLTSRRQAPRQWRRPMPPTLAPGKIFYVQIPAADVDRSVRIYETVFDWNIRRRRNGEVAIDDTVGEVSGT